MKTKNILRLGLLLCCVFAVADAQAQRTVTMRLNMASVPDTINGMGLIEVRGAGGEEGNVAPDTLADGTSLAGVLRARSSPLTKRGPTARIATTGA